MSDIPDFEIKARLSAEELTLRVRPDAQTFAEGEEVELEREERRHRAARRTKPDAAGGDVDVETRTIGQLRDSP